MGFDSPSYPRQLQATGARVRWRAWSLVASFTVTWLVYAWYYALYFAILYSTVLYYTNTITNTNANTNTY